MNRSDEPREQDLYVGVSRRGRGARHRRLVAGMRVDGRRVGPTARLWFGIVLVLLGVLWTFDNLGFTAAGEVLHWWPVLLLAYGLARLTGTGIVRSTTQGVFFTVVGVLLLAARLAHVAVGLGVVFPLLTILAGVSFVRRGLRHEGLVSERESDEEAIEMAAILGGATTRGVGARVRRANLTALLGGLELDLREARPEGGRMDIEVFACLGGIEIVVPESWRVESSIAPIAGGFDDRSAGGGEVPACVLRLHGAAVLGGVTVRNQPAEREVRIVRRRGGGGEEAREAPVAGGAGPGAGPPPPVEPE